MVMFLDIELIEKHFSELRKTTPNSYSYVILANFVCTTTLATAAVVTYHW